MLTFHPAPSSPELSKKLKLWEPVHCIFLYINSYNKHLDTTIFVHHKNVCPGRGSNPPPTAQKAELLTTKLIVFSVFSLFNYK